MMTPDLYWLTLTALMTALLWVPYVLERMTRQGLLAMMGNRPPDEPAPATWAQRAKAAHLVAVENLPIFVALVLVVHLAGVSNAVTTSACALYFFGMLTHYVVFTLGIPYVRTAAYLVAGFGVEVTLALSILGII
jgi:uncharacterized MAPEG superfamily protein